MAGYVCYVFILTMTSSYSAYYVTDGPHESGTPYPSPLIPYDNQNSTNSSMHNNSGSGSNKTMIKLVANTTRAPGQPETGPAFQCPSEVYKASGPVNIYLNDVGIHPKHDGNSVTLASGPCNCPPGTKGEPGRDGIPGDQGPPGPSGPPGISAPTPKKDQFIAFSAVIEARPFGPYEMYQIVRFDNILVNEGNAYDEKRGVFTAPVSGYYQFNIHIHTVVDHQAEVRLILENKQVVLAWADGTISKPAASKPMGLPFMPKSNNAAATHEMGSSNSAIIHVNKGEKVYCILPKAHVLAGLGFTSFSGHLMRADQSDIL